MKDNKTNRRVFLANLAASAALPAFWSGNAFAQATQPAKFEETDPMAIALGYKEDTTKVDKVKYPNHKPEQKCNNCALYQGKAGDPSGPCAAVGGKLVTESGWCSVWAQKPEPAKG